MWMWMFFRFELTNFCHFSKWKICENGREKCMENFEDLTEKWLHSIQKKSDLPGSKTASDTVTKTQISILEPLTTQDLQAL